METWSNEKSQELYRVNEWGQGYFKVNAKGHLSVHPIEDEKSSSIELAILLDELKELKIELPVVIRFNDILISQVKKLYNAFSVSIKKNQYKGEYKGVFPIKVNQMREVVEEVIDAGSESNLGLEAGSKTELLSILAYNENPNALTILNGYKDYEFMRLACLGTTLGRNVVVVIEQFSELALLVKAMKDMNSYPLIGFRGKLQTKSCGKWDQSTGDFTKFGLSSDELLEGIEYLKKEGLLKLLKLFHFHIGSQIPDLITFQDCIREGARTFCELIKEGAHLEFFDAGGGLGIDYIGTHTNEFNSVNYNWTNYADSLVRILKQICEDNQVPHPTIVTESGRALVAHHSCIVVNVFGKIQYKINPEHLISHPNDHLMVQHLRKILQSLEDEGEISQPAFDQAEYLRENCIQAFKLGVLSLKDKAKIDSLYWEICRVSSLKDSEDIELQRKLSSKYLCNFSLFQSAPDVWAIDQKLPIMPLLRLNEEPSELCTLADITCDSDGSIKSFDTNAEHSLLPLHALKAGEDYPVGIFLTGAYQDIMGDMHNLFGRLNEVHIYCDSTDPKGYYIEEIIKGDHSAKLLSTLQYNPEEMAGRIKKILDQKIKNSEIKPRDGVQLSDEFENALGNYTYLRT